MRRLPLPPDPQPRDDHGNVIPHDHSGIMADDGVIRRISEQQLVIDQRTGGRRISSLAFKASTGPNAGMSVDLEQSIVEAGLDPRTYVTTPRWFGSIRFRAEDLRIEMFQVGFDPIPDNPHHGQVWGNFTRQRRRRLRELCTWFVPIENAEIGQE